MINLLVYRTKVFVALKLNRRLSFEAALWHGSVLEFRGAWEKFPIFPTSTNCKREQLFTGK